MHRSGGDDPTGTAARTVYCPVTSWCCTMAGAGRTGADTRSDTSTDTRTEAEFGQLDQLDQVEQMA